VNITVHHEIPVQSIILVASFIGVCIFIASLALRSLQAYLDRQLCNMELNLDDETDIRMDDYLVRRDDNFLHGHRDQTVANGAVQETKQ
jgi:hypothetical protein